MTDLLQVLPSLPVQPWSHLLHSLERAAVSVADILTLDPIDVAKHAQLPAREIRRLADALVAALHTDLGYPPATDAPDASEPALRPEPPTALHLLHSWTRISLLDPVLDAALNGGIPTGYITEFTGEAGAAKTQFLFTLLLSAQLLPRPPTQPPRTSIYLTTESALSTPRLTQLLSSNPVLQALPPESRPSLSRILCIAMPDLEAQDHILRYQLPVAIARHHASLVVLDSVTANFRAELDRAGPPALARRAAALLQLCAHLRALARRHDCAVVVANQVSDRFDRPAAPPPSSSPDAADARLTLEHQQRWFTGWGDRPRATSLKTPSLGLVWANQLDARIVLQRWARPERAGWRRSLKVVFAPWAADHAGGRGIEFVVAGAGVQGVPPG